MQVSIETTAGLERRLTITVPFEGFEGQIAAKLNEAARSARLPGFRPGKVPLREIKRRFGVNIRAQVISDTMQSSFNTAVQQESLRPAGAPAFDLANPDVVQKIGDDLKYTAVFEVMPEVELKAFSDITVERPNAHIGEDDIDRMIERLRKQRQTFTGTSDRGAEDGDQLLIDFVGKVDGEAFAGGTASQFELLLGQGKLLKDFEMALVGVRSSETRSFPVAFPDDYGNAELKGKTAEFTVSVHEVRAATLPEVDEAFMMDFGVESGGIEKFRAEILESMERELEGAKLQRVKNQVFDGLASLHSPQLPNVMVSGEIERMRRDMLQRMGVPMEMYDRARANAREHDHDHDHDHDHNHNHNPNHNHDHGHDQNHDQDHDHDAVPAKPVSAREKSLDQQLPQLPDALFQESAERRVRIGLVLSEIIRSRALQPDDEKVRAMIRRVASAYNDPESVAKWYYSNEEQLARIEQAVLEEQVVELVVGESQVSDLATSYDDLIAPRPDLGTRS